MAPRKAFIICRYLFWFTDTTIWRLFLGVAALFYAVGLCFPGLGGQHLRFALAEVVPYRYAWVGLFLLYFVGVFWRFIDVTPRVRWALAVNALGCGLWLTTAVSVFMTYSFTPGAATNGVLWVCSAWVLLRTALTSEIVTP